MTKRTPAHLITRAEMARRLGVSRACVTKACRPGGRLAKACRGTGVNALHPAAQQWLAARAAAAAPPADAIPVDAPDPPDGDELGGAGGERQPSEQLAMPWVEAADLGDLSEPLTTLTERYGSAPAMTNWVKCRKTLEEARKAEMLRERVAGRLIARTTVVRMIDHVDGAFRLLLSDAPRTIATRLGLPDTAGSAALIRDIMSQHLEAAQSHMIASLEADDPMAPLAEAAE